MNPQDHFPCLHCHPQDYIRMVQHLIERCLLFHMSRDDCIKALAKYAGINPIVTLTVWKELLKENKVFFQAYFHATAPRHFRRKPADRGFNFRRRKYCRLTRRFMAQMNRRVPRKND
ncbi:uncharacterized protein LOC123223185 [Mangifera indica]|uniref:uncharacterized protein LOC123223185 n=1 Tax=Mangifera indica TaxID=29780 RepID=UPI001CFBE85F|nr:uncharacterized protein LOC123223185 [Mangifera indica]